MDDSIQRAFTDSLFRQREAGENSFSAPPSAELYECVRSGDVKRLEVLSAELTEGELSAEPLRSLQYQFAISIAFAAQHCLAGGMEPETAYSLQSFYIRGADNCESAASVNALHRVALLDFGTRMQQYSKRNIYSRLVSHCMEYIFRNLHSKLTLGVIAAYLDVSESHLSRVFHQETGVTLRAYIIKRRVEEAMDLLRYSDYSSLDIANYLCFSSHSHFISVFKAQTGMTPREYRNRYTKGTVLSPM